MPKTNVNLHNDTPELKCELQRDGLKNHILNVIMSAQPPKTVAIHGTWGTGKTSLMAQLYTDFGGSHKFKADKKQSKDKSNSKIQVVWFDAWQYQHEENILVPLLHEIRTQLTWKYKFLKEVNETVVPGLLAAIQSVELSFAKIVSIKGFGEKFQKNEQEYLKERFSNELGSEMLRKMLQEAISQLLNLDKVVYQQRNADGRKLVVFIDDLDRCEPDTAYKVLEAIKVYLNLDNCLFVLGMDILEVERMLAKKYEKLYDPKDGKGILNLRNHARLYLEKICQDVFHLPVLDRETRISYFRKLLAPINAGAAPQVSLFHQIIEATTDFNILPPFPRSIKMLANTIISHQGRDHIRIFEGQENRTKEFLILSYLYTFHFEIYQMVYLYQDKNFYNQAFLKYCKEPDQFKDESGGGHPMLDSLFIPKRNDFSGATANESQVLNRLYPHEGLRQVLWITELVKDVGEIDYDTLKALKI